MKAFKILTVTAALSGLLHAPLSHATAIDYEIDPTHTMTLFSWSHFGFSNPTANFNNVTGTIHFDDKNPAQSSVEVVIPVSSVDTHVKKLDEEFLTSEWFNVSQYPNIMFKSNKVQAVGKNHYLVSGQLTVKGISKPVVLDTYLNKQGMHEMKKKPTVGFHATTHFNRSAFGLKQNIPMVSDDIKVMITTEASSK